MPLNASISHKAIRSTSQCYCGSVNVHLWRRLSSQPATGVHSSIPYPPVFSAVHSSFFWAFSVRKRWRLLNTQVWTTRTVKTSYPLVGKRDPRRMVGCTMQSEYNLLSSANMSMYKCFFLFDHKRRYLGLYSVESTSCMRNI